MRRQMGILQALQAQLEQLEHFMRFGTVARLQSLLMRKLEKSLQSHDCSNYRWMLSLCGEDQYRQAGLVCRFEWLPKCILLCTRFCIALGTP